MSEENGGWLKYVLMWDWHELCLKDWPGWDRSESGKNPPYVEISVRKGTDTSSRDLAIRFDDLAEWRFYYRDWTGSGLPFVSDGEVYRSGFWFQKKEDREKFLKMYQEFRFATRKS